MVPGTAERPPRQGVDAPGEGPYRCSQQAVRGPGDDRAVVGWAAVSESRPGATGTEGAVELLGAVAYGELRAFTRLAADAERAPDLAGRAELASLAAVEAGHYRTIAEHLAGRGVDVLAAMAPFVEALDAFHRRTEPRDWPEALVAAHLGRGLAADLQTEVAERWSGPADEAELIRAVTPDPGFDTFAERAVHALCEDPRTHDRLALWGRRLLGETVAAASIVLDEYPALVALLGAEEGRAPLFKRLKSRHGRRMQALGL